ncbi:MAG: putative endopeptidase [Thermoanaerobaculia bacterium]|jgi:endothelin-converting enzyme/putative endopeptidase|nr:putative endopeptidase [Thermoanaerobaculia bacterium]
MKRFIVTILVSLSAFTLAAQTAPAAKAEKKADKPLTQLPYTPSLDVKAMDQSVEPCTDFYQYSCGNWMAMNPIPPDQASWSVYGKVGDENARYLWGILDEASKPSPNRTKIQAEIGDYFAACMNESAIEKLSATPIEPLLKTIDAMKSPGELAKILAEAKRDSSPYFFGTNWLFRSGSTQDLADASKVIAEVDAGGLGLPDRDYYTKTDDKSKTIREKYVNHVAAMLELIGEKKPDAAADAKTVLTIETALAEASLTRVEKRDPHNLDHKMTLAELAKITPSFDWPHYFAVLGLPKVDSLNVAQPKFFATIESEVKNVSLADWKTYLRWHAVHAHAQYLSSKFVAEDFNFYRKTLRGVAEMPPRWKTCVRLVDHDLADALGQEFVRKTFTAETRQKTIEMTRQIEHAMEKEIASLDWMTDVTKKHALEKLHAIANKVGYPDRWRDYSSITIKPSDFYGNTARAATWASDRDFEKVGKPVDRAEWFMSAPTVNAWYNPQLNDINFPAGVLQPPLYDPKLDDAPNYGNTGSTIGHELTHAFDDEGRQFDAAGNLKDWWTADDGKAFDERIQCVRDQYAGYTIIDDIKINSKLTSGEDVADLGGTLLAYIAWKEQTENEDLKPIDGFTPDQRFFIGFAQWACENQRPENARLNAITNAHSPGKYRINGIVSDLPQFQKAFKCGDDKPMVSKKVCKVW